MSTHFIEICTNNPTAMLKKNRIFKKQTCHNNKRDSIKFKNTVSVKMLILIDILIEMHPSVEISIKKNYNNNF